ncbi:YdcF family protein [bacterium]|nr:YdcF family protein [bacterium]
MQLVKISGKVLKAFLPLFCIFLVLFLLKGEKFLSIDDDYRSLNADAVVVLAGPPAEDMQRVFEGAKLLQNGCVQYLILPLRHKALQWSSLAKSYKIDINIPENRILFGRSELSDQELIGHYGGTFTEAKKAIQIMLQNKLKSAIIISSGYHMRRTRIAFERARQNHPITFFYHPVQNPYNDKKLWWMDKGSLFKVLGEYKKLIAAFFVYK